MSAAAFLRESSSPWRWGSIHQPVEARAGDVEHVRRRQHNRGLSAHRPRVAIRAGILVAYMPLGVPVHLHAVGHERVQRQDLTTPVADDLRIAVPP